jgi:thymidylate synthase (FAD)
MKPVNAKDIIQLDGKMKVTKLQGYMIPEQVIWQAAKNDYSEIAIEDAKTPLPDDCGKWVVEELLANERGHWGPLEHPQITFSCTGFVHSVIVQARTHRIGTTWDVQSQRYTGKRVIKVANKQLKPEEVFYVRPPGYYTNRKGKKYEWTKEQYDQKLQQCVTLAEQYAKDCEELGLSEEHARDYLPQAIRQNFVVSFNLRSILHFMDLRAKLDAQLEIQALCELFAPELEAWVPNVWKYYETKRLHKARLSP